MENKVLLSLIGSISYTGTQQNRSYKMYREPDAAGQELLPIYLNFTLAICFAQAQLEETRYTAAFREGVNVKPISR
jgi:hypothetical protein